MRWGSEIEVERRRRIRLSVAAYAYEIKADSVMSDADFDALAMEIDPDMETGPPEVDDLFRFDFTPYTGMWIHHHPDHAGLERIYKEVHRGR